MNIYKHNKTGNLYYVLTEAINCTNANDGEEMVVYKRLDGDDEKVKTMTFVRNKDEFNKKFTPTTVLKY